MKIAIAGAGYVGLSLATLLAQNNEVVTLGIHADKAKKISKFISPIKDEYIEKYFSEARSGKRKLNLRGTTDYKDAMEGASYVIIATPTDYSDKTNSIDTSIVEDIIQKVISMGDDAITIVVKSTIPIGFIKSMRKKYGIKKIFFSPEFLREGKALYDNLYPSRIVIGDKTPEARKFAKLLQDASLKKDAPVVGTKITQSLKYRYVEMEKYSVSHPHTYCASRDSNGSCTSWGTYYTYTYGTQVVGGHNGQREITASGTVNTPYNYILVPYVKHSNTNGITYPGATFNTESFVATIGRINQQVQSAAYATHTKNTTIRIVSFTTTGTPSSDVKYINNNNMTDAAICSQAGGTGNCTSLYSTTKVLNKGDNQLNGATNESASIDNGGSNVNNTISASVPLVNPGTRFCVAVGVYPADSHNRASTSTINDNTQTAAFQTSGTGWKVSMPACVTVAKKPTFSVESSQLVTEGSVKTSITNASNRLFGSWSEYGIIAKGNVDSMGSGAAYGYTTPYNSFTPNGTSTHAGAPRSASNKCVYSPQTIGNESCVLGGATIISSSVDSMAVARKVDEIYHMTKTELNEGYRTDYGIVDIADASNYYGSTT